MHKKTSLFEQEIDDLTFFENKSVNCSPQKYRIFVGSDILCEFGVFRDQ